MGEDAAILRVGGRYIAVHTDPISGSGELLGWLAVNVAANDIAVRGIRPMWISTAIFLPPTADEGVLDRITAQVDAAARELGIAVVGGHTEVTSAVVRPLVVATAIGEGDRYVSTGGARPGDEVIMTKSVALEAASILATDFRGEMLRRGVPEDYVEAAAGYARLISVVREALALADIATSMHDPTEGGVLAGLAEVAHASNTSIEVDPKRIPVPREVESLCRAAGLDPLATLSSGALLATVPGDRLGEALERLRAIGTPVAHIGRVTRRKDYLVKVGELEVRSPYVRDRIFELFQRGGWSGTT